MYFDMDWNIRIYAPDVERSKIIPRGFPVIGIEIENSVKNLADTARVIFSEAIFNQVLHWEQWLMPGDRIEIELGYNGDLKLEFAGYIDKITRPNGSGDGYLIDCIDSLRVFKKSVKDVELKPTTVKQIADYIISQIDPSYKVVCDQWNIPYEKFTIHAATGYDVLKQLQESTAADVYFNEAQKTLYIMPPFIENKGDKPVKFSMFHNIESSNLSYIRIADKPIKVVIETVDLSGKAYTFERGTTGGDEFKMKTPPMSREQSERLADDVFKSRNRDRYEGDFTGWLIPFVQAGYSVTLIDDDYPEMESTHYVDAVKTSFSSSGGQRTVSLGIKLN